MREAELMARDRWSSEDLAAFQRERVRALVAHAMTNSPYYLEVLGADAAERPLTDLPTLPKATMMAEFDHIVTDPRLRLDDLRAHLAGVESPLPNPTGRPWRCLLSVDGRTADILYLPGPDGATVPIHPSVLGSAVAPIAEVGEYAFVYDVNGLHAQIVLTPGASPDVPERLRDALGTAIGLTGAIPPAVEVRPVPALEREPGGKIRLVRSA